jgi:DNA modification methylase
MLNHVFKKIHARGERVPSTVQPIMLAELIQAYSRVGNVVLDPFCSNGSALVAAKGLGRRYIGIEIDAEYADTARKQLEA